MTGAGEFVEVQGTPSTPVRAARDGQLDLATAGVAELLDLQRVALA